MISNYLPTCSVQVFPELSSHLAPTSTQAGPQAGGEPRLSPLGLSQMSPPPVTLTLPRGCTLVLKKGKLFSVFKRASFRNTSIKPLWLYTQPPNSQLLSQHKICVCTEVNTVHSFSPKPTFKLKELSLPPPNSPCLNALHLLQNSSWQFNQSSHKYIFHGLLPALITVMFSPLVARCDELRVLWGTSAFSPIYCPLMISLVQISFWQ